MNDYKNQGHVPGLATELADPYIDNFKKVWVQSELFERKLEAVDAPIISVEHVSDEEVEAAQAIHGQDLFHKTPSLILRIGDRETRLTWNEAYNLADMLLDIVGEDYYG